MTKEITNKDLAKSIENLAIITKNGFDGVDKQFKEVKSDIKEMKTDIFDLKQGQEDIQSKLKNVAYSFEMEEIERKLEEKFEKRFKKIERTLDLSNT